NVAVSTGSARYGMAGVQGGGKTSMTFKSNQPFGIWTGDGGRQTTVDGRLHACNTSRKGAKRKNAHKDTKITKTQRTTSSYFDKVVDFMASSSIGEKPMEIL